MNRVAGAFREAESGSIVDERYLVKREIARGAMGVILEAQHRILGTTVALKTLTERAMDWSGGRERLMREGRALAICKHPNVVAALDAGRCDRHGPFLALEMVEGRSLESVLLARGRLGVDEVVRVARQLCDAIHHTHRRGVIHRDIKPQNVIVVHENGSDGHHLRLLDYGIATVPGDKDVVGRKLTGVGELLGTWEYVAPEQLLDGQPADALSDVYALGVLLYECLVGAVPYVGGPTVIMAAMIGGTAPKAISEARSDVPRALEEAIMAAMSRDPVRRPQSVEALWMRMASLEGRVVDDVASALAERKFARVPYAAPIRLLRKEAHTDGRSEDISEGGMLLVADAPLEQGEPIQLKLPLPSSGKVATIEAVARWSKSARGRCAIGLAWVSNDERVLGDIRQYVHLMTRGRDQAVASADWLAAKA